MGSESGSTRSEDRRTDANQGRTLCNSDFEITGHPHRKLFHRYTWNIQRLYLSCQGSQFAEIRAGCFRVVKERGHGHQPADTDILQEGNLSDKLFGLFRSCAAFRCFAGDIDLYQDVTDKPEPSPLPVNLLSQRKPVNRVDHGDDAGDLLDLVALQMPDEVPLDSRFHFGCLRDKLLYVVLPKNRLASLCRLIDH